MVIPKQQNPHRRQAAVLMTDLVVAIGFLCVAVIPLALSFAQEHRALLAGYQRAVAMEIVDGEMELLVAGEWRSYTNGIHQLIPQAKAAANLPSGKLQLTVAAEHLVLEWRPSETAQGGIIRREITLK